MIREFAVEPEVMETWQHFRELFHQFGVSQGRLISEFPSKWRKTLYELVSEREKKGLIDPTKAKSICDRIAAARDRFCGAQGRSFDPALAWLANAESQHKARPFHVIIVSQEPRTGPNLGLLVAGDFDPEVQPWKVDKQIKLERSADAFETCASLMLSLAREIVLVDPYFDPRKNRFREPFGAWVRAGKPGQIWTRCELHTELRFDDAKSPRVYDFEHNLPRCTPRGQRVAVHFWDRKPGGEKLHARYLLTELGGLQFDYGLDTGEPGETTVVTLLDHSHWAKVREDYRSGSTTFVPAQGSPIQVVG